MSISIPREKLKGMNFRGLATGLRLEPVHPGQVLMKDFIEPMGITRYKVAKLAGVQQRRIDESADESVSRLPVQLQISGIAWSSRVVMA